MGQIVMVPFQGRTLRMERVQFKEVTEGWTEVILPTKNIKIRIKLVVTGCLVSLDERDEFGVPVVLTQSNNVQTSVPLDEKEAGIYGA